MPRRRPLPPGPPPLDRKVLARALSKLGAKALHTVLIRLLDRLDDEDAQELVEDFVDLDALRPAQATGPGLLREVQDFARRSLEGAYYEDFDVNSRTFMQKSEGTKRWIRVFNDLSNRVIDDGDDTVAIEAVPLLLDLLARIDDGEDFLFFADEQGAWQVGANEEGLQRRLEFAHRRRG